jgi:RNA:NAD 2'-phosphotransferase (TPT1/KptA family)
MVRECRPPARRRTPIILTVDAAAMHAADHAFYQAANGV